MDSFEKYPKVSVQSIKGVNERKSFANDDLGELDILRGAVPTTQGTLTKINGIKRLLSLGNIKVLNICQTNDSRGNIIIQTEAGVYLYTASELFGVSPYVPNLNFVAFNLEEESMSRATIYHSAAANTGGGTYTTANVWQQAPLSAILTQLNPDGTPAAFVTAFAANRFTLSAGYYRINGWSAMSDNAAGTKCVARLWNVTAAAPAFNGGPNENSDATLTGGSGTNEILRFGGDLDLHLGGAQFEIQGSMNQARPTSGFGSAKNLGTELYRWIEIIKTA